MVLILFIQILSIIPSLAAAKWIKDVNAGKVSRHNISLGFLIAFYGMLFTAYLGWKTNFFKIHISIIFCLTMASIFLITAIEANSSSSDYSLEESKVWLKWLLSLLVITYLIVLCFEYPKTKKELEMIIIPTATFVIARYIIRDK